MRAAAENLTPVTLELGGKSPAIIGARANFEKAVERIVVGKSLNAGQTCIAPDYVMLPAGREQDFIDTARRVFAACYPDFATTPDYTAVVNERHFARLTGLVDEARTEGAEVVELVPGVVPDPTTRRFPPLLLSGVNAGMRVMQEEIFGPLLPIVAYERLEDAIAFINARERPLALYYFDDDAHRVRRVLSATTSGGVTVNDCAYHLIQNRLPFGGIGLSGMGAYHGFDGFETFSHKKGVFLQNRLIGDVLGALVAPPYSHMTDKLISFLLRRRPRD